MPTGSCWSFAGVPTALVIEGDDLAAAVGARYAAFSIDSAPVFHLALRARGGLLDPDPGTVDVAPLPAGRHLVRRGDFVVEIDPDAGTAMGDLRGGIASVDSCLRVLLSIYLAPRRGLLLHAAGVVDAGVAYVFYGPSGAGKSTVVRLSAGRTILSDELTAIHVGRGAPAPEDAPVPRQGTALVTRAVGTPFWGELEGAGSPVGAPLAGLYRLVQFPEAALQPLSPCAALRSLMPCVIFFARDPALVDAVTETCLELATSGRCHELRFRRDPTFWAAVSSGQR